MKTVACKDEADLAAKADAWFADKVREYKARNVFLPSGGTPKNLYALWEKTKPTAMAGLQLTQLDEIVTGSKAGCFGEFFREHLPTYAGRLTDLQTEQGPPDLVILGLGTNGHVGFHEPHMPHDFIKGLVELEPDTCHKLGAEPHTQGYSFGVGFFRQAKAILLMIQGPGKDHVAQALLHDSNASFPAALLRSHTDFTVLYIK